MSYITMADLGQSSGAVVADDDTRRAISKQAIELNARARSTPVSALQPLLNEIRAATTRLNAFQAWPAAARWFWSSGWDSSQTVRANLQAATNDAQVRSGAKLGVILGQQRDVNVYTETASNLPGEVRDQGKKMADCVANPIQCWWDETTKGQKAAMIAGGVVVVGAPILFYFGGFIKALGNVAARASAKSNR